MSEFVAPNSIGAIEAAKKAGQVVVFPAKDELQIDIDDAASLKIFKENRRILAQYWNIISQTETPSKSGKPERMHITLTISREITPLERCALQAMLGSDRKREILSLIQVHENDPHPTLFIESAR